MNEKVYWCPTKIISNRFIREMIKKGKLRIAPERYFSFWDHYQEDTCYRIERGNFHYCSKFFYMERGYEIVPAIPLNSISYYLMERESS